MPDFASMRPRFRRQFQPRVFAPDLIFVLRETGFDTIEHRLNALIVPLLDGVHTVREIAEVIRERRVSLPEAVWGIEKLVEAGYVEWEGGPQGIDRTPARLVEGTAGVRMAVVHAKRRALADGERDSSAAICRSAVQRRRRALLGVPGRPS